MANLGGGRRVAPLGSVPMRRRAWLAGLALLLPLAGQAAGPGEGVVGTWLTDGGASKVEVSAAKAGDGSTVYNGTVVWLKEPTRDGKPLFDVNNADPAQRGRPILGMPILSGFRASAGGWSGGTVYSPRAGKAFPAELALAADGRLELKVKTGLLSKTDYWTR